MEKINGRLLIWSSILEPSTREQAERTATMPFIHPHLALMPDAHLGKGATVGSVVPTEGAIITAAVGVDIGCGMVAVQADLPAVQLPDSLARLRSKIEQAVPHGRSTNNNKLDRGAWSKLPKPAEHAW